MAEEFGKNRNTGTDEDLLRLDNEEYPAKREDLSVTGKHKSYKKKKNKAIYPILIVLLLCVMGYSGYQIAATFIRDLKADKVYENIEHQYLLEDDPTDMPVPTEPSRTETSPS